MSVTICESEDQTEVTIAVRGRFDFSCHQDLAKAYGSYDKHSTRFIMDLNETEYMDSSALGMLLQLRDHARGGEVSLINGNESVREVLRIANFDKLFTII